MMLSEFSDFEWPIKTGKVILSTRSMHPELCRKSHSLFDQCESITGTQAIKNVKDWEYLYEVFFCTDAAFVISADEDFFCTNPRIIDEIIKYMYHTDIDIIGPNCSSTIEYSGIIDNWFHISNTKRVQKYKLSKADLIKIRAFETPEIFPDVGWNECFHPFDKHEMFFLMMKDKGCKFELFNKRHNDMEALYARKHQFGFHTRQGRDYDKKEIKEHIDEVFDFVRRKYHEKHFGNS